MASSSLSSLLPLIILFFIIIIGAAVGFVVYQIANDVADKTSKKMEKHNVSLGPGGMKIGVKHKSAEEVGDSTQSALMKVWNHASWPEYKSKLGWGQTSTSTSSSSTAKRQTYSRSSSSQQSIKKA